MYKTSRRKARWHLLATDNLLLFLLSRNASIDATVRQILKRQLWKSDEYHLLTMCHVDYIWKSEQIVQHHNVCYLIF